MSDDPGRGPSGCSARTCIWVRVLPDIRGMMRKISPPLCSIGTATFHCDAPTVVCLDLPIAEISVRRGGVKCFSYSQTIFRCR